MATLRLLQDEIPTQQDAQCKALASAGCDIEVDIDPDADETEEIEWGADPFDILAHKESKSPSN